MTNTFKSVMTVHSDEELFRSTKFQQDNYHP